MSKRRRCYAPFQRFLHPGFESAVTSESSVHITKTALQFLSHEYVHMRALAIERPSDRGRCVVRADLLR